MKIATYNHDPAVLAADLVNTRGSVSGRDYMADLGALETFLGEHGIRVPADLSEADLAAVGRVRDRLKEVFFAPDEATSAQLLNRILADHGAAPRLAAADPGWGVTNVPEDAGLAPSLAITTAMGLAEMVVSSGRSRFGICSADDCLDVFVDTSRNRSRRYCADSCSSRSNVAAFRARQRSSS